MSKILAFNINSDYTEVADSIGDGLQILQDAENALSDGLQIGDAFVLLSNEDEVREIINDGPVFVSQLKQLSADTSRAAVMEAGNRIINNGKPVGKITRFVINSLWGTATGYSDAVVILDIGQRQVLEKQALIAGKDIFPGFLTATA